MRVSFGRVLNGFTNGLVAVAVGYWVLAPEGPIRGYLSERAEAAAIEATLRENWSVLREIAIPLDEEAASSGPVLIEATDYECPFCRRMHNVIAAGLPEIAPGAIAILHFPLAAIHPRATRAALTAICAADLGTQRELHDLFFSSAEALDLSTLDLARELDIPDPVAFQECVDSEDTAGRLDRHLRLGEALGISGTPAFITRTTIASGTQSVARLRELLEVAADD